MARVFFGCGHLATAIILLLGFFSTNLAARDLRLATTTSTDNSGLLRAILPQFELQHGIRVQVISVGTGKALKLAENGDVDVVLVHDRQAEEAFVAAGYGVNRRDVMYNDFVIVGPGSDPAALRGGREVLEAFRQIAARQARFVSRGDDSGTERMERSYWQQLGMATRGAPWYVSAGLGMGEVLTMAGEMQAYTLTSRRSSPAMIATSSNCPTCVGWIWQAVSSASEASALYLRAPHPRWPANRRPDAGKRKPPATVAAPPGASPSCR